MNDLVTSPRLFALNDEADALTDFAPAIVDFIREKDAQASPLPAPSRRQALGLRPKILIATPLAQDAFLHGIARFAREHHWQLDTDMLHCGVFPQRWEGDGILSFEPSHSDFSKSLAGLGIPCVTVSVSDDCEFRPRVEPDNFSIGQMAAEHLISRGCRHFVCAPYGNDSHDQKRLAGFLSVTAPQRYACKLLPPRYRDTESDRKDWKEWRREAATLLKALPERTGVFALNDCLSLDIVEIAQEAGIAIPERLAIIGVGNNPLECEASPIALSSIDLNLEEMAYQAARMLAELMDHPHTGHDAIITVRPGKIAARDSTALSATATPRTEQALEYIAQSYPEPSLSVASVAEALGISRRQLERDFRSERGSTVREYIERTRMTEASRLLLEHPSANVTEVARLVGISAPGNFFRTFRKRFGTTPAAYRAEHGRGCDP